MSEPLPPDRRHPRRRFERHPEPKAIALQARDLDIVRATARFRFIDTEQVMRLTGASQRVAQRTLTRLFDHKMLDRPLAQKKRLLVARNESLVYALGREGARLLAEQDGTTTGHIDWSLKNSRAGALFIEHTLATTDVMVGFHLGARDRTIPIVDSSDLLPYLPELSRSLKNPFALRVEVRDAATHKLTRIGVIPDRVFSLVPADRALHFCLELDTGEMPVERKSLHGTSVARKLHAFWQAYLSGLPKSQWGFAGVRVLIVTSSTERITNIREVLTKITGGRAPNMVLFGLTEELRRCDPLAYPWITGGGDTVQLLG